MIGVDCEPLHLILLAHFINGGLLFGPALGLSHCLRNQEGHGQLLICLAGISVGHVNPMAECSVSPDYLHVFTAQLGSLGVVVQST